MQQTPDPQPRPIRLVAVDLDGTLLDDNGRIPPANRDAIRRLVNAGVRVVAATGRTPQGARAALATGDDPALAGLPLVALNGARVAVEGQEQPLAPIPLPLAQAVVAWMHTAGLECRLYRGNRIWSTTPITPRIRAMIDRQGLECHEVDDLRPFVTAPPDKLALQVPEAELPAVHQALAERWGEELNISASDTTTVEIMSRDADKGKALAWLARRWGVSPQEALAIGNERNDLGMVRWAGVGLAVANAHPDLVAAARHQVPSNNEAGVAAALNRWLPPAEAATHRDM